MRESNFAFPSQNKACVCITSQLYDRRALDTTGALPLFNSLTHLTYLTSTSPRIREIMTMDGGLERLVRILHDFCIAPPPPDNPAVLYGLLPSNFRPPKHSPVLNPASFDKHAAYRFSLAFQCVVNIGVRGSEPIRSRVVQAGTLDVVGCILEAWLANKGFAVAPSSSATGMPRETREQRQARRIAQVEQRQREQASQLALALNQQIQMNQLHHRLPRDPLAHDQTLRRHADDGDGMTADPVRRTTSLFSHPNPARPTSSLHPNSDTDLSDNSMATTPIGTGTISGAVVIPSRDRSGTVIARTVWDTASLPANNVDAAGLSADAAPATATTMPRYRTHRHRASPSSLHGNSRPDTETEDDEGDGDGDIDMDPSRGDSDIGTSESPSPGRIPRSAPARPRPRLSIGRRAVGIVSDDVSAGEQGNLGTMGLDVDAHIIINEGGRGVVTVGVEDGIVSLEPNDDFAMGAPPGAPGAMEGGNAGPVESDEEGVARALEGIASEAAPDATPRAAVIGLPIIASGIERPSAEDHAQAAVAAVALGHQRHGTLRGRAGVVSGEDAAAAAIHRGATADNNDGLNTGAGAAPGVAATPGRTTSGGGPLHHRERDTDTGPYSDEDVLLSLQLLAYLSKYPHVRQAFYKPRTSFHPASASLPGARYGAGTGSKEKEKMRSSGTSQNTHTRLSPGAGAATTASAVAANASGLGPSPSAQSIGSGPTMLRQTNVFSLVERFTFKPSSAEAGVTPRLPAIIQYWAGVIMRNACRKDDSRGGIRQCANMLCGRWEAYPREFAKCRRCRKAKYCGKECQSTAWSEGHRFWCSAKEAEEDNTTEGQPRPVNDGDAVAGSGVDGLIVASTTTTMTIGRRERDGVAERRERERERERLRDEERDIEEETPIVREQRPGTLARHPFADAPAAGGRSSTGVGGMMVSLERTLQPGRRISVFNVGESMRGTTASEYSGVGSGSAGLPSVASGSSSRTQTVGHDAHSFQQGSAAPGSSGASRTGMFGMEGSRRRAETITGVSAGRHEVPPLFIPNQIAAAYAGTTWYRDRGTAPPRQGETGPSRGHRRDMGTGTGTGTIGMEVGMMSPGTDVHDMVLG